MLRQHGLGPGQGPLAPGLPAVGVRAAEKRDLGNQAKDEPADFLGFDLTESHMDHHIIPGATSSWGRSRGRFVGHTRGGVWLGGEKERRCDCQTSSKLVVSPSLARTLLVSTSSPYLAYWVTGLEEG